MPISSIFLLGFFLLASFLWKLVVTSVSPRPPLALKSKETAHPAGAPYRPCDYRVALTPLLPGTQALPILEVKALLSPLATKNGQWSSRPHPWQHCGWFLLLPPQALPSPL